MFIATALAVGSFAVGTYGAVQASKGRKAQARSQREQAEFNAEIAQENMIDVEERGLTALRDQQMMTLRNLSSVRSAGAASGVVVDQEGTSLQDSVVAMAEAGTIDVRRLRENIDREKRRAEVQGLNFTAQAEQFEIARAGENPFLSGLSAGLNSASKNSDILFGT
tara:strand:+ start:3651 stop:4148 length:498 start_codon:yes stop_codon:yes gene_type:complete